MFDNIGEKLKGMAEKLMWGGALLSAFIGCVAAIGGLPLIGVLIIVVGVFWSWLGAHLVYGFGQLIVNTGIADSAQSETAQAENSEEASEKEEEKL